MRRWFESVSGRRVAAAALVLMSTAASCPESITAWAAAPVSLNSITVSAGPTSGSTSVTLNGNGFDPAATVKFGSTAGLVAISTLHQIVVLTPASSFPLTVDVDVDNPDGGKAKLPFAFHYYEPLPARALNEHPAATILAMTNFDRLDVFGRGTDNALYHDFQVDSNGTWGGTWENLGGVLRSAPAAVSWGPGRLDVFVRGSDNGLWHRWFSNGAWSGWESLGGILNSGPAVASWGEGRLDVFLRGSDNGLWHKWWDGAGWSGYESLGGIFVSDPGVFGINGKLVDVFVHGTDNGLWHKWWDAGWHGYEYLGPSGQALTSSPAASSNFPGNASVFVLGPDNDLLLRPRGMGVWKAWRSIGTYWNGPWAFGPAAASQGFYLAGVDVFEVGADGNVWHANIPHSSRLP
jgi:hypothetical protein